LHACAGGIFIVQTSNLPNLMPDMIHSCSQHWVACKPLISAARGEKSARLLG
jgi:hypothetical protein